jgi:hypothetical protein
MRTELPVNRHGNRSFGDYLLTQNRDLQSTGRGNIEIVALFLHETPVGSSLQTVAVQPKYALAGILSPGYDLAMVWRFDGPGQLNDLS